MQYYAYLTVTVIGVLLAAYISVRYLLILALPFLIAWGVAFSVRPMAQRISTGTRIPRRVISVLLTVLILAGGIAVVVSAIVYALGEAVEFLSSLLESDELYSVLDKILNPIGQLFGDREGAEELRRRIGEAVSGMLSSLLSGIGGFITGFIGAVPRAMIFVLVTLIASIYFSLDLDRINTRVRKTLPKRIVSALVGFKQRFLSTLVRYLRSYLVIMLITFMVMLFGFLVLGVEYAVLLAFVVALLDALPLIGVGTVLVPWSVYQMIFSNFGLGLGLAILFVLHAVLRQFIEPRIIGKSLGMHPIISLILLYTGYYLFGFLGLLLIPLLSVLVNILISRQRE